MFSWKGRDGSVQWISNLGNNSCNNGFPTMMVDNGVISNKNLLPVTSLSYGPMPYESQSAKVKLGPLTCHPPPENERYVIRDHIESIEKNMTKFSAQIIKAKQGIEGIDTKVIEINNTINTAMNELNVNIEAKFINMREGINECHTEPSPCNPNENCVDLPTGFECVSHCASNPCSHGQCLNQINGYQCQCEQGYTGQNCDEEINHCDR